MWAWYQNMGWAAALMFGGVIAGAGFACVLWVIDRSINPRKNRRVSKTQIRITAAELDTASVTGQFYVPYGQTDKKGVTK